LLFADEDQAAKVTRDPVAPAKRSTSALEKVHTHITADGTPAHSLRTLIAELATLVRNTCTYMPPRTHAERLHVSPAGTRVLFMVLWRRIIRGAWLVFE